MNYIDITILITVGIGIIVGLYKGLIREVAGLVALVAGIVGARMFAGKLEVWLSAHLTVSEQWSYILAWSLAFIGIALLVNGIGWLITRTLEAVALGCVNKLLGGIFGGIKYILLFSVLFNLIGFASEYVNVPGREAREQSMLYEPVKRGAAWSLKMIREVAKPEIPGNIQKEITI